MGPLMAPQLPFFRKYRRWKVFTAWKRSIRWRHMRLAGEALHRDLFLANPHLRSALLKLRLLCRDVAAKAIFQVDPLVTYTIEVCVRVRVCACLSVCPTLFVCVSVYACTRA